MKPSPQIHLAPMEGVVDSVLREILTADGSIDLCFTEFIRVTNHLIPTKVLFEANPELLHPGPLRGKTKSGTPVIPQFLGSHPQPMAENAAQAIQYGALGVDLNFGCPAKTVNRHDGGATLLKTPERIFSIVSAVRKAVPLEFPVTAKIRLGFDSTDLCLENSQAVEAAGAQRLTVHCRTRTQGYAPPAHWDWIPRIQEKIKIPVVANGEIWTLDDFKKCHQLCQSSAYMIGRGLIAFPQLAQQIKAALLYSSPLYSSPLESALLQASQSPSLKQKTTNQVPHASLMVDFFDRSAEKVSPRFAQARTKQWLRQISQKDTQVLPLFEATKAITHPPLFRQTLENWLK